MIDDAWQPRSTCDSGCLPGPGSQPAVHPALALGRLAATGAVVLAAVLLLPLLAVVPTALLPTATFMGALARTLLSVLGVSHSAAGRLPRRRTLIVANHVSWLDILVLLAHCPASLLAKHDVRAWPAIGRLATSAGTVFVDRTKPRRLPATVAEVRARLAAGGVVAVFPEGTTWCGQTGGRFRPAMFQAAIDAGAPVVPVALTYSSTAAAFLGEDTLLASLGRVALARGLTVRMRAYPALHPMPLADRRTLARAARAAVGPLPVAEPAQRTPVLGLAA